MEKKQSQIKINLPLRLKKKFEARAEEYDMTLAGYVRHLMVNDINSQKPRELKFSADTIKAIKLAKKEEREGKLEEIKNVDEFFDKLF
jgi:hypothetical protein